MAALSTGRAARATLVAGVLAGALAASLSACGRGGDGADPLPAVVLPALEGFGQPQAELDTDGLAGPVVLNLWATRCVPCRRELPEFQRASEGHPGVRFLGIDEGFDASESVAFLGELGVGYEQFVDVDGALADELGITELPATVVVDADGDMTVRHVGALSYGDLVATLADLS